MLDNVNMTSTRKKPLRCAIYTRKSHEEGLEQEFNSLDALREKAKDLAMADARKKAEWHAGQLGKEVVGVVSVRDLLVDT